MIIITTIIVIIICDYECPWCLTDTRSTWGFTRFEIMTVSYSRLVANGSSFGCFGSILCKWVESLMVYCKRFFLLLKYIYTWDAVWQYYYCNVVPWHYDSSCMWVEVPTIIYLYITPAEEIIFPTLTDRSIRFYVTFDCIVSIIILW